MHPRVSEPSEHVSRIERREVTEATQAETSEEVDHFRFGFTKCLQPPDRKRRTKGRRLLWLDDHRTVSTHRQSSRHARREPPISHTDTDAYHHPDLSNDVLQVLGHRSIAAEVLRWPSRRQADPSGLDHIEPRRYLGNSTDHRLEFARIPSRIVIDQFDLRTPPLRLTPALPDHHPFCCRCCGTSDHPVCRHHRRRQISVEARGNDWPVRKPHRDHAHHHGTNSQWRADGSTVHPPPQRQPLSQPSQRDATRAPGTPLFGSADRGADVPLR